MKLAVSKSILRGKIAMPGSKSHTIRAITLASLASGESEILAPLDSADTRAAVNCYQALGARIDCSSTWKIQGIGGDVCAPEKVIDVANSGTTLRFALGSASLLKEGAAVFTGDTQICSRPAGPLLKSLNDLGAKCVSKRNNNCAPFMVEGTLKGGETSIEAVSSQYLSSLLINAPLASGSTVINVTQLNETPYIEMTLKYLDEQGIRYENRDLCHFRIEGGQSYRPFTKKIPGDFSSATFFLCAGALLDAELTLEGLDFADSQGDKAVVDILKAMGADIQWVAEGVRVRRGALRGMDIDMNATPDALPALAVLS